MALRVLLADESTTIKKVMQLALQDFAVDVKSVQSGIDVLEVCRTFQPDLIFADVLLQKKNGYEVCADLKSDEKLSRIPVVLMWSSFMDLDERAAAGSGADRRLEKPFDVEALRQLVLELVPKTRSQRLAHFLKFPETFSEPMKAEEAQKATQKAAPPPEQRPTPAPVAPEPPPRPTPVASPPSAPIAAAPPQPKPVPPPTAAPPPAEQPAAKSTWNMESFADPSEFEDRPPVLTQSGVRDEAEDLSMPGVAIEGDDEGFQEVRINTTSGPAPDAEPHTGDVTFVPAQGGVAEEDEEDLIENPARDREMAARENREERRYASTLEPLSADDRDPWSHQDLSRFRIDIPSGSSVTDEIPDVEIPDEDKLEDLEGSDFLHRRIDQKPAAPAPEEASFGERTMPIIPKNAERVPRPGDRASGTMLQARPQDLDDENLGGDLLADPHTSDLEIDFRAPSTQGLEVGSDHMDAEEISLAPVKGGVQISPERLEAIVRAQSKDIIEQLVRKLVPDIAADLIREELNRLLDDDGDGDEDAAQSEPRANRTSTSTTRDRR